MQAAGQLARIGDPFIVRSPSLVELCRAEASEVIGVDQLRLRIIKIDIPQVQPLVGVGDLLAVGRPRGRVKKRRRISEVDMADLA